MNKAKSLEKAEDEGVTRKRVVKGNKKNKATYKKRPLRRIRQSNAGGKKQKELEPQEPRKS